MMKSKEQTDFKSLSLISIAIVGVVAAIIMPPYNHMPDIRLPLPRYLTIVATLLISSYWTISAIKQSELMLSKLFFIIVQAFYLVALYVFTREQF